jgi:uncharacterized membrane protein YebE (DUF533 family)
MTPNQKARLFCLVHILWSDDFQAPEELGALESSIRAEGLEVEVRDVLLQALAELPPTPEALAASLPDEGDRREALEAAVHMAFVDGVLTERERVALQDLARAFGISEAELKERLEQAKGEPDAPGDALPSEVLEALRRVGAARRL